MMSRVKAVEITPNEEEEKPRLSLVEPPVDEALTPSDDSASVEEADETPEAAPVDLVVYIDSLGVSILDRFSLVRVFREEWRSSVAFYRSKEGGELPLDKAIEYATHQVDEQRAAEILERLLTTSAESIDFDDLHKLWMHSSEEAVRRTQADPRRHSYEYAKWERYKREVAKARMWENDGYWEIPYASEVECQEQAVKMSDHFSRLFQRSMRALDNHRLAKAKLKRLSQATPTTAYGVPFPFQTTCAGYIMPSKINPYGYRRNTLRRTLALSTLFALGVLGAGCTTTDNSNSAGNANRANTATTAATPSPTATSANAGAARTNANVHANMSAAEHANMSMNANTTP
jgi:hypothetical protein